MELISDREEMIFKREQEGRASYSIGLSKKREDGTYENGYMPVRFRKGTELKDKTKIKIKEAWLDFFKIEKKTIPYIFINKFELPSDAEALRQALDNRIPPREHIEQQKIQYTTDDMDNLPFY